jgi:hypothetical protein
MSNNYTLRHQARADSCGEQAVIVSQIEQDTVVRGLRNDEPISLGARRYTSVDVLMRLRDESGTLVRPGASDEPSR